MLYRQEQALHYALNAIKKSPISPFVTDVILFGSCARGEEKYSSDVDLLLVLTTDLIMMTVHFVMCFGMKLLRERCASTNRSFDDREGTAALCCCFLYIRNELIIVHKCRLW